MPAKITERATDYEGVDRWDGGVGWIAHPEETMRRTSHALATDEGVWLVDPVDAEGVDDLLAEYGTVAGVVVIFNHHTRDAEVLADRHGVSVHVPAEMDGISGDLDARVERTVVGDTLGEYELLEVARTGKAWQEYALYDGDTLVVAEAVGTAPYFCVDGERLGVSLMRRLTPPLEALGGLEPDRILLGHGEGIDENAAEALEDTLSNSRRRFPRALLSNGGKQVRTMTAAVRT